MKKHIFFLTIIWGTVIIATFVVLSFTWAIFSLLFVFVLSPILSMILYAPIRNALINKNNDIKSKVMGSVEALSLVLVYYLLGTKFDIPKFLVIFIVLQYSINQINRFYRSGDRREANEFIWFLLTVSVWYVALFFI